LRGKEFYQLLTDICRMNLLIVAATVKEIEPYLETVNNISILRKGIPDTDVLITGIGLTATTYSLGKQLSLKKYDLVLQAGVAGCFDTSLALGTVVAVKKDTIADQSVIELNELKSLFDLKLVPDSQFPYTNKWLANTNKKILSLSELKQVNGISVNEITTDNKKAEFYRKHFKPMAESMEGAALHYVCLMEGVPFLQIRSMSNYITERDKSKWDMTDSINNLNNALFKIIRKLYTNDK
jgi:futalosine hydrolase